MTNEETRAKEVDEAIKSADARKRADAEAAASAGEKLDSILKHLDSMSTGVDSLSKRMDAYDDKARRDAEEKEKKEGEDKDKDKPEKDGDSEDEEEMRAAGSQPGDPETLVADSREWKNRKDAILADIQSRADRVFSAFGKTAPAPMSGERISSFRRRILGDLKHHSGAWRDVDLYAMSGKPLRNVEQVIYADAMAAASNPQAWADHNFLREHVSVDRLTGQRVISFTGHPSAWTNQFKSGGNIVTKFNVDRNRG